MPWTSNAPPAKWATALGGTPTGPDSTSNAAPITGRRASIGAAVANGTLAAICGCRERHLILFRGAEAVLTATGRTVNTAWPY